jgi:RNA recognition motif-containing protein
MPGHRVGRRFRRRRRRRHAGGLQVPPSPRQRKKPCACGKTPAAKREERPFEKRKPHPAPADGSVEIYVGNLSYDMTEDELRKTFEAYGKVNSARLITNRYNGKSKGFGFVQMPNRPEAEKACAELNDKDIMGRKMKCNEAKNLI